MKSNRMQFLRTGAVLMALGLGTVGAFAAQKIRSVGAREFHELVEKSDGVILDVRTEGEVEKGKIPKAIQMDFYGKEFVKQLETMNRETPMYVYCRSGSRSMNTAKILDGLGFDKIVNLEGGFQNWKKAGLPVETEKQLVASSGSGRSQELEALEHSLSGDRPVLVDFYAKWCSPRKRMMPAVDEVADQFERRAGVLKIDVDKNEALAKRFGV